MAGCMMFVFAALGEFVIVKVLDLHYQCVSDIQSSIVPRSFQTVRIRFSSIFHTIKNILFSIPRITLYYHYFTIYIYMYIILLSSFYLFVIIQRLVTTDKSQNSGFWDYDTIYATKSKNNRAGSKHLLQTWLDLETSSLFPYRSRSQQIDRYSRIGFPILFLLFVVLYWPILLLKKAA